MEKEKFSTIIIALYQCGSDLAHNERVLRLSESTDCALLCDLPIVHYTPVGKKIKE